MNTLFKKYKPKLTPLGAVAIFLSLWGCLAVYNATFYLEVPYYFVGKQVLWLIVGVFVLMILSGFSEAMMKRLAAIAVLPVYLVLTAVLFYGIKINGMRGWFSFNGIFLQPSELAKPLFVLLLALVAEKTEPFRKDWRRGYLPLLGVLIVWVVPIFFQPDFGAIIVYVMGFTAICWCLRVRVVYLLTTLGALVPVLFLLFRMHPYTAARLQGFLNPQAHAGTTGWHIIQFQNALASGGIFGRSMGHGMYSKAYLPLSYSDSMFACLGESLGFVGLLPIILLLFGWMLYGYWRFSLTETIFRSSVIIGISFMIGGQALLHLSVNLGLCPVTGLTLPLLSYGGSSLVSTLAAVGILEACSGSQSITAE